MSERLGIPDGPASDIYLHHMTKNGLGRHDIDALENIGKLSEERLNYRYVRVFLDNLTRYCIKNELTDPEIIVLATHMLFVAALPEELPENHQFDKF